MWKLGLWPRNSFSGNVCVDFSALVLCSVVKDSACTAYNACRGALVFSLHAWWGEGVGEGGSTGLVLVRAPKAILYIHFFPIRTIERWQSEPQIISWLEG